jgi:hypothetical protein
LETVTEGLIEGGCDGFIQKPYDLSPLSQIIKDVLEACAIA